MTIEQIYSELNNVVKGITGFTTVTVADHKGFVSLGNDILNSNSGVELFGKSLGDRIAKILSEVDSYIARNRMLWTDNITYGSALKIVHFKDTFNSKNDMYGDTIHVNPSDKGSISEPVTNTYSRVGVWDYSELVIFRNQLEKAFISESEMASFLDSQFTCVYNARELDKESTDNIAINTMIAQKLYNATSKPMGAINLIKLYNDETGLTISPAQALRDKEFLRFSSMKISQIGKQLNDKTILFNNLEGVSSHTPTDRKVVEVLTDFANACKYYLEADTYNADIVSLGDYNELNYIQGYGNTGSFTERSTININLLTDTAAGTTTPVEQSGIVGIIRDKRLVRTMYDKVYADTYYNPATRGTTYFFHAEKGYMIDNAYNGVIFYLKEIA